VNEPNVFFFGLALVAYLAGTLLYEAFLVLKTPRLGIWATRALASGGAVNGVALAARWIESGRAPLANLFEALSFWAWLIVLAYLVIERIYQQRVIGAFVAPLAFFAIGLASIMPKSMSPLVPVLQSVWLPIHVSVSFLAYTMFAVAFGSAVIYLLQERQLKSRRPHALYYRLPPLTTVEALSYRVSALGFIFMALALMTGMVWSEQAWGSYWAWEPKQTMSLVTFLIYAAYFHARNIAGWRGRRASWILIVGFGSALATFLGVMLLTPGQHDFTSF
jgi:cytochrome c-type biogenesis protein CcsB